MTVCGHWNRDCTACLQKCSTFPYCLNTQNKCLEICKIPLSFTYVLVPDFKFMYEDCTWRSFVVSSLCDNPQSMFYWHVWPHDTWEISFIHSVSHLSQSTYDNVPAWMDQANAYWSWYPVYRCSQKQWMVSLQVSSVAILVQPLLACSSKGGVKNLCVKFSPHHMKKEGCNCSK